MLAAMANFHNVAAFISMPNLYYFLPSKWQFSADLWPRPMRLSVSSQKPQLRMLSFGGWRCASEKRIRRLVKGFFHHDCVWVWVWIHRGDLGLEKTERFKDNAASKLWTSAPLGFSLLLIDHCCFWRSSFLLIHVCPDSSAGGPYDRTGRGTRKLCGENSLDASAQGR